MDFVATLCGFAKFGEEFGVLCAYSVRLFSREELAVEFVADIVESFLHLAAPWGFLLHEPRFEARLGRRSALASAPRGELWKFQMALD
jgi:hypothetical protein